MEWLKRTRRDVDDGLGSGRKGAQPRLGGEGPPPTARAFQFLERVVLGDHACHRVEVTPRIGFAVGVALRDLARPPIAGGAAPSDAHDLILEAADGNRFMAFSAMTPDPDAPGIMILPDIRGLHPFYKDLAIRFAEAGVNATAMDYFGRTAGLEPRAEDFDFMSHVKQLTPDGVGADSFATVAHLRSAAGGGAQRVYSVGFCMGGRISFNQHGDLTGSPA